MYAKLIELCADICKRYGKTKLLWLGDKTKTLNYEPASNEMVLTVHRWFANKSCPGDWMYARMGDLASKVTAKLGGSTGGNDKPVDNQVLYRVQTGAFANKAKGLKNLADHIVTTAFEGEVEVTRLFKYGEDFFIGDIVQIANEYGNEGSAYISELVISNSEEGLSIYPTFKTISK